MRKIVGPETSALVLAACMLLVSACGSSSDTSNVVNGTIMVKPASWNYYTVVVQSSMSDARLTGTFTASGGILNATKVEVMDAIDYTNWSNGNQSTFLFNSGLRTTDTINVSLPSAGTYYLVYDNTWSSVTKQVRTKVDLDHAE